MTRKTVRVLYIIVVLVFILPSQGCGIKTTNVVTDGKIAGMTLSANSPIYYAEGCPDCGGIQREREIDRRLECGEFPQTYGIYKNAYSIDSATTFNVVELLEIGYIGISLGKWSDRNLVVLEDNIGRLSIMPIESLSIKNKLVC